MIRAERIVASLLETGPGPDDDDFDAHDFVRNLPTWRDTLKRLGYKELQFTGTIESKTGNWSKRFNHLKPDSFRILITEQEPNGKKLNAHVEHWVYSDNARHNRIKFKNVVHRFVLDKENFEHGLAEIEEVLRKARTWDDAYYNITILSERGLTESEDDDFDPRAATRGIVAKGDDVAGVLEPMGFTKLRHGDYPDRLHWRKHVGQLEDHLSRSHLIFLDVEVSGFGKSELVYFSLVDSDGRAFGNNYWSVTLPMYLPDFIQKLEAEVAQRHSVDDFSNLRYELREKGILSDRG